MHDSSELLPIERSGELHVEALTHARRYNSRTRRLTNSALHRDGARTPDTRCSRGLLQIRRRLRRCRMPRASPPRRAPHAHRPTATFPPTIPRCRSDGARRPPQPCGTAPGTSRSGARGQVKETSQLFRLGVKCWNVMLVLPKPNICRALRR